MNQPDAASSRATVDSQARRAEDRRMEVRLVSMEADMSILTVDVAKVRETCARKEDVSLVNENVAKVEVALLKAMNDQTWKFVTWVSAMMAMMSSVLTAVVYLIARNVH